MSWRSSRTSQNYALSTYEIKSHSLLPWFPFSSPIVLFLCTSLFSYSAELNTQSSRSIHCQFASDLSFKVNLNLWYFGPLLTHKITLNHTQINNCKSWSIILIHKNDTDLMKYLPTVLKTTWLNCFFPNLVLVESILQSLIVEFYVHVTAHRNKFLYNKTNQVHQFHKFTPAWNSTYFGQFLCPSSGVYSLYAR